MGIILSLFYYPPACQICGSNMNDTICLKCFLYEYTIFQSIAEVTPEKNIFAADRKKKFVNDI
jgi:hypothetical protein